MEGFIFFSNALDDGLRGSGLAGSGRVPLGLQVVAGVLVVHVLLEVVPAREGLEAEGADEGLLAGVLDRVAPQVRLDPALVGAQRAEVHGPVVVRLADPDCVRV